MLVSRKEWFVSEEKNRLKKRTACFKKRTARFLVLLFKQRRADQVLFQEKEETQSVCFRKPGFVSKEEKEETQSVCFRKPGFVSPRTRCCFLQEEEWFVSEEPLRKEQVFVSFKKEEQVFFSERFFRNEPFFVQ